MCHMGAYTQCTPLIWIWLKSLENLECFSYLYRVLARKIEENTTGWTDVKTAILGPFGGNGQKKAIFRGPHTHVQISRQGCMVENRYYYRSRPYMDAFHPPERGPVCAPTRHTHPPSTIFGVQFSGPIYPWFWGSGVKMTMVVPVGCTYWGPHLGWIKVLYECVDPQSFMT